MVDTSIATASSTASKTPNEPARQQLTTDGSTPRSLKSLSDGLVAPSTHLAESPGPSSQTSYHLTDERLRDYLAKRRNAICEEHQGGVWSTVDDERGESSAKEESPATQTSTRVPVVSYPLGTSDTDAGVTFHRVVCAYISIEQALYNCGGEIADVTLRAMHTVRRITRGLNISELVDGRGAAVPDALLLVETVPAALCWLDEGGVFTAYLDVRRRLDEIALWTAECSDGLSEVFVTRSEDSEEASVERSVSLCDDDDNVEMAGYDVDGESDSWSDDEVFLPRSVLHRQRYRIRSERIESQ